AGDPGVARLCQTVGAVTGFGARILDDGAERGGVGTVELCDDVREGTEEGEIDVVGDHAFDHARVIGGLDELDGRSGLVLEHLQQRFVTRLQVGRVLGRNRTEREGFGEALFGQRVGIRTTAGGQGEGESGGETGTGGGAPGRQGTHGGCPSCRGSGEEQSGQIGDRVENMGRSGFAERRLVVGAGAEPGDHGGTGAQTGQDVAGRVPDDGDVTDVVGTGAQQGGQDHVGVGAAATGVGGCESEVGEVAPAECIEQPVLGGSAESGGEYDFHAGLPQLRDRLLGAGDGGDVALVDESFVGAF